MESSLQALGACFLWQGLPSGLAAVFYTRLILCFCKIRKRGGGRGKVEPDFTEPWCHWRSIFSRSVQGSVLPHWAWVPQSSKLKRQVELHLQLQAAFTHLGRLWSFPFVFSLPVRVDARSHHFMCLKLRLAFFSVNLGRVLITACSNPLHIHSWLLYDNDIWHQYDLVW